MSRKRALLILLCSLLGAVALVLLVATVYMERMLGLINRDPADTLSASALEELLQGETGDHGGPVYDPEDISIPSAPTLLDPEKKLLNILLIGQDRRDGQSRSLSDAMILCTLNRDAGVLTMTSFLRDSYVRIPGRGNNKLNAAYPMGGMELLDATLTENFGVTVDGNIEVDFSQFERIIDLLGGVEITLTDQEARHLQHEYGFELKEGPNRLTGAEALGYARIRKLGTDFARTDRQRAVLTALIEQFRGAGLRQLHKAAKEILSLITTDMSNAQLLGYAMELAPLLKNLQIRSQRIPADGTYSFGDAGKITSCIFLDFEANRALLRGTILETD